jgi:hypothetical protein
MMGQPNMIWSPVQLILSNQHNIVLVRILTRLTVNIDGVRSVENFEVIKIVDGSTPYPVLLGLDWEFDNKNIIYLKNI